MSKMGEYTRGMRISLANGKIGTIYELRWETVSVLFEDGSEDCIPYSELPRGKQALDKEICICAAIRLPNGMIFRGHRHTGCIQTARIYTKWHHPNTWSPEMCRDQGFITSRNRYVGREEALKLQQDAGIESVSPDGYRKSRLFSEDLY